MALTPTIKTSTAGVVSAITPSGELDVGTVGGMVVYSYPSDEVDVSTAGTVVASNKESSEMNVSAAGVMIVAKGRLYNPKLKAWTYTLDSHDYYVLRLSEDKTLVFDLTTAQWSWFSSGSLDHWRLNLGTNWYSPNTVPHNYGSNIICGDDTFGHLWVLDPLQAYDDNPQDPSADPVRFPRVATGQIPTRDRTFVPIYEVNLGAAGGYPYMDGDLVEHSYSDDAGVTYVSAGTVPVEEGNTTQDFSWRSLGIAVPAGRLFRISDDGALARIDGLDVYYKGSEG